MKKIIAFTLTLLTLAVPTLAADAGGDGRALGVGLSVLGFGIAAGLAGIGQGLVGGRAAEGAARNPGASSKIQTLMILGLAFIESLVIFALVIFFAKGL
jgi:F-type H+-transporting ATPase subunit c